MGDAVHPLDSFWDVLRHRFHGVGMGLGPLLGSIVHLKVPSQLYAIFPIICLDLFLRYALVQTLRAYLYSTKYHPNP